MKAIFAVMEKTGQKVLVLPDMSVWEIGADGAIKPAYCREIDIRYALDEGADSTEERIGGEFSFTLDD